MKRLAAVLLLCLSLVPTSAAARPHLDEIALPNGWQPEGITTDGHALYAGSLVDGAIWKADPRTGAGRILAKGSEGRVAVGIDYDRRRDLLWVAGGPTMVVRAHDADTGKVVREYPFALDTGRFLNDLVVTKHAVYATDSMNQELAVVPLHRKRLPAADKGRLLPLTGDLVYTEGFNLNGIVASHRWLLAVQSNTGLLFRIHPRTGDTTAIDLGGASVANGDGLEWGHKVLYVVQNFDNRILPLDLNRSLTQGTALEPITSDRFMIPTTAAFLKHSLYAVNARFDLEEPTPDTEYWITRVDALRCR